MLRSGAGRALAHRAPQKLNLYHFKIILSPDTGPAAASSRQPAAGSSHHLTPATGGRTLVTSPQPILMSDTEGAVVELINISAHFIHFSSRFSAYNTSQDYRTQARVFPV